ncbi:MAG: B3/4 domain-containing protein [bacterium]|nr:B3/4 domain-containing protein [bacterium]
MKQFILEQDFLEIFPEAKIGVIIAKNVKNTPVADNSDFENLLEQSSESAKVHLTADEFSKNQVVASWREAFKKFKSKKGNRSSIEALLKRIDNGRGVGSISPLVDVYNSVSLEFAVPCGGEDLAKIAGNMRLTLANGDENFITLGSEKSEPPLENELIYKDEEGAVCRCWNWREAVRTMLTDQTTDAVFIIENWNGQNLENFHTAIDALKSRLEEFIGGQISSVVADKDNPSVDLGEF